MPEQPRTDGEDPEGGRRTTPPAPPTSSAPRRPRPDGPEDERSEPNESDPDAPPSDPQERALTKYRNRILAAAGVVTAVTALVANLGNFRTSIHDAIWPKPSPPATSAAPAPAPGPSTTSAPTPPTAAPSPTPTEVCGRTPATAPFTASFASPCQGASTPAPWFFLTVRVPEFPPDDGSRGAIAVTEQILGTGTGSPNNAKPRYAVYFVTKESAARLGPDRTWIKDVGAYKECEFGAATFSLHYLTAEGYRTALDTWKPAQPITIPQNSILLDEVDLNLTRASTCPPIG
ncbi:hypothetical protein ACGFX4_11960 [Kitasatospora sp. NPDC048365]|uniref:hypothetical protein n=1 Tax=Kitasatospora sp. NPDC048365 TaxID=3364050 RepID=UPI003718BB4F